MIEVDDAFKIEFRAEQVEKYVLTVALVHLATLIGQFVKHWEGLRCIGHARDHLTHT